jgi:hypothetical protein
MKYRGSGNQAVRKPLRTAARPKNKKPVREDRAGRPDQTQQTYSRIARNSRAPRVLERTMAHAQRGEQ